MKMKLISTNHAIKCSDCYNETFVIDYNVLITYLEVQCAFCKITSRFIAIGFYEDYLY